MMTRICFVDFSINPASKSRLVDIFDHEIPYILRALWQPLEKKKAKTKQTNKNPSSAFVVFPGQYNRINVDPFTLVTFPHNSFSIWYISKYS